jgi:hypothetical protein
MMLAGSSSPIVIANSARFQFSISNLYFFMIIDDEFAESAHSYEHLQPTCLAAWPYNRDSMNRPILIL